MPTVADAWDRVISGMCECVCACVCVCVYSSLDFVRDKLSELVPEGTFCHLPDFLVQSRWTATPSRLTGAPISAIRTIFTPFPFFAQPYQFILAWDRHQICWLAYPVALFTGRNVVLYARLTFSLCCCLMLVPNFECETTTKFDCETRIRSESTNLRRTRQSGGSGFRTLDSRIRSVIRIATKIVSLGP